MLEKAKRCSLCGISYPYFSHGDKCDVCEGPLDGIQDAPDSDWRESVALAKSAREAIMTNNDPVLDWRMKELFRAGYDRTASAAIAAKREIDLHDAVDLILTKGCDPKVAAAILL
jgi:hypothetical protein